MSGAPIIEARGLSAGYGASRVLHDIDLAVMPGETIGLMGRNGMGKTTLIRALLGQLPPQRGQVLLDGKPADAIPVFRRARLGIAVVPENRGIFATLSVLENLRLAARPGLDGANAWTEARVLSLFPRLTQRIGNLIDTEAADALMGLPISIDDTPGLSIMELRTKARRISVQGTLGVVVVDYLQLMRTGEHEENRVQEIATITRNLKSLARELNVTVIALSQLSRAAGDAGTEPRLSTLRESGSIEQDSDIVMMLWRDKDDTPAGAAKLIHGSVAKNRNGPTGRFDLYFEAKQARFFSRADDEGMPA